MRKIVLILCAVMISLSFTIRPKLEVQNNLIYTSMIKCYQEKNTPKFQKILTYLDPLLEYLKATNKNLRSDLTAAYNDKSELVFQEKLSNIIKADILDVLTLISLAKIQCNQSYDLNIGFSSYQIMSPYVKKRHGEELDKKIRKKFQTILKIHTTDHGGKKHRHCTKEKADAIIDLMQVINTI
mgnify:CR=1 FL=1|tara:strand:- start:8924 stop:9472 length:549 start_codon:yes stop_codon:yes gene_type:complete